MLEAIFALLIGLLIGSFLNVCIYRWPRDLSVVRPRSHCPECEQPVAWFDNIPLVSFAVLGGRCRHCHKPISPRYLVVEALTGALFFGIVWSHGPTLLSLKLCTFSALLIGLIITDLEARILPDEFTFGGMALGIVFAVASPLEYGLFSLLVPQDWAIEVRSAIDAILSAALASGVLWLVGQLYLKLRKREGLGLGDVKMVAMMGTFLGIQGALMSLVLGSILGAVLGMGYILATRKDASTYELPFGSFLGVSALVFALFQTQIFTLLFGLAQ